MIGGWPAYVQVKEEMMVGRGEKKDKQHPPAAGVEHQDRSFFFFFFSFLPFYP